jgi:hypothetical protein
MNNLLRNSTKMKTGLFIVAFTSILFFSCNKEEILPKQGYEVVTLKNLSGLDCCGYVLQKSDSICLEPTNLSQYINPFVAGKKFKIKYKVETKASCCMVGPVISIVELVDF